jgi:hypothetical protein
MTREISECDTCKKKEKQCDETYDTKAVIPAAVLGAGTHHHLSMGLSSSFLPAASGLATLGTAMGTLTTGFVSEAKKNAGPRASGAATGTISGTLATNFASVGGVSGFKMFSGPRASGATAGTGSTASSGAGFAGAAGGVMIGGEADENESLAEYENGKCEIDERRAATKVRSIMDGIFFYKN